LAAFSAAVNPPLTKVFFQDPSPEMRWHALGVISCVCSDAARKLQILEKALSDDYSKVRACALLALKDLGPAAAPAALSVCNCLGDQSDEYMHFWAVEALLEMGRETAMAALDTASKAGNKHAESLVALLSLGENAFLSLTFRAIDQQKFQSVELIKCIQKKIDEWKSAESAKRNSILR
jgi:hypothetical protein